MLSDIVDGIDDSTAARSARYLQRLLLLLSAATFFQGYDNQMISILLPDLQRSFHVGEATLGVIRVPIDLGLLVAFFVARLADRFGRRPILLWSIVGYTILTGLTAMSWNLWAFAGFQFGARVFLGAEYAIGITMVVEEFSAKRRGRALGMLLACSAFGTIAVGLLVGAGLRDSPLGWRSFYLIGLAPLLAIAYCRRQIQESQRFSHVRQRSTGAQVAMFAAWAPPFRRNLVRVGLVYFLIAIPQYGAFGWLAFHAERELNLAAGTVALFIIAGYGLGCSGFFVCGWAMRRFGRRNTILVYGTGAMVWLVTLFQVTAITTGLIAMFFAVFCTLGMLPAMSALATELFPTEIRGAALAWIRNVFEIAGTTTGPALVGVLGDHTIGLIGNVGQTVSLLCVLFLPALWIVWRLIPETEGRLTESA